MRTNARKRSPAPRTHEGAEAKRITAEQELRRSVMSCFLWEDEFYESGESITKRITKLASKAKPSEVSAIAIEARTKMHLRHAPLWLTVALASSTRGDKVVRETINGVIQRADELTEFLSMYFVMNPVKPRKGSKRLKAPLSAQVKKGLVDALRKFDEHALSKYHRNDRGQEVKLRDILRLARPKPENPEQEALWGRVVGKEGEKLAIADTWENAAVRDSSGKNAGRAKTNEEKAEPFVRKLKAGKMEYFALLRNLRNLLAWGVDKKLIEKAIIARTNGAHRILPFRYVSAVRAVPEMSKALNSALIGAVGDMAPLSGLTVVLVDVSGSMDAKLSQPRGRRPGSDQEPLSRADAAAALACIVPGDDVRVFTFSNDIKEVQRYVGLAGIDQILRSQLHAGTELGRAVKHVNKIKYDRLIVITDEQSHDQVGGPRDGVPAYMINVASAQNGVGYRDGWTHIDGFSDNVIRYIQEVEGVAVDDGPAVDEDEGDEDLGD